jgi:hypothetical protein
MSPIYDLDESTIFGPVKLRINGKEYTVPDVDKKEFQRISEIPDPYEQFAAWAQVPLKEVEGLGMRKIAAALRIIAKELLGPAMAEFKPKKD